MKQPAAMGWDPSLSDEDVLDYVKGQYQDDSEFCPMEEYRSERAKTFGED